MPSSSFALWLGLGCALLLAGCSLMVDGDAISRRGDGSLAGAAGSSPQNTGGLWFGRPFPAGTGGSAGGETGTGGLPH